MKDIVNVKIKFREPFRPFAPSVLSEKAEDYFVLADRQTLPRSFHALCRGCERRQARDDSRNHSCGRHGRLQTVHKKFNPKYYRLIETFRRGHGRAHRAKHFL